MCQHPDLSPSSVSDAGVVSTQLRCFKSDSEEKLGVSFFADEPVVRVRLVHKGSLAAFCGLQPDDVVMAINGVPCETALDAARTLRNGKGELWLSVERRLSCYVGDDDEEDEDAECMLSPPRRLFSPPKSGESEAAAEEEPDASYDEASAEEWHEWLFWMTERIRAREAELSELQQRTAEVLVEAAEEEQVLLRAHALLLLGCAMRPFAVAPQLRGHASCRAESASSCCPVVPVRGVCILYCVPSARACVCSRRLPPRRRTWTSRR